MAGCSYQQVLKWRKGDHVLPYGLNKLAMIRKAGWVLVVEAKRFSLSEESIRTVLGIRPEEPEPQSRSILARLRKRLGF